MGRVAVREANWKLNAGKIETLGTSDVSLRRVMTSSRDKADKAVPSVTGSRGSAPFAYQALVGIDSMGVFKKGILPATKWC